MIDLEGKLGLTGAISGLIYYGVVTDIPGANAFSLRNLAGLGAGKFSDATQPYYAFVLRDAGGAGAAPQGEMQAITVYATATGSFTTAAFSAAVAVGDEILILHPSIAQTVPGADGALNTLVRDVVGSKLDTAITVKDNVSSVIRYLKGLLDKQPTPTVLKSNTVANWQTAEADIVSIGANNTPNRIGSCFISLALLTVGAVVTLRMYKQINDTERQFYQQSFTIGTDPPGVPIIDGPIDVAEVIRITAQSDTAGDNGKAIHYDYLISALV